MSRQFNLKATVNVDSAPENIDVLEAVLSDENTKVGKRAEYVFERKGDVISISVNANDSVALKAAISAVSSVITLVEKGLDIE